MRLTRPGENLNYKIAVSLPGQDGYFLCISFLTSVIMAQIIIVKVNKSVYVTIYTTPFRKVSERMEHVLRLKTLEFML